MTETRMNIQLDMQLTPEVLIGMQDGPEASLDHVVGDTLIPDRGYAGMAASYAGTVVTIGTGRLYSAGKVYAFDEPITFDVLQTNKLPRALKRIMLLIAYGNEQDSVPEQVNFLVEAQSTPTAPVYKPQAMATEHLRIAVVSDAYGDEAANPVWPSYGLALPIAVAVLTPTGIQSLVNLVDGKLPNLADVAKRVAAIEAFDAVIGPEVSTLAATLAGLAKGSGDTVSQSEYSRVLMRLAAVEAKDGIPSTAADSSLDYLLDGSNSDLTHPLSSCKVQEGIRFPDDNVSNAQLQRFNAFDTATVIKGGVMFPAYDRFLRQSTGPKTGSVLANAYYYNPVSYTQKTIATSSVSYGAPFLVCSNSDFWKQGQYDPITGILALPDGRTYRAAIDLDAEGNAFAAAGNIQVSGTFLAQHTFYRAEQFWTTTTSATYWDAVVQAPQAIPGFHLAESELIGQDQWIDAIGFYVDALDAQGDVTLLVCEAGDDALVRPHAVLGQVTIPYGQLVVGENIGAFLTPVLREAGKHVATVIVTTAAHKIGTTDGSNFPQGTFLQLSQSGYQQSDLTRHLALNFYGCKFRQSALTVQMEDLSLGGGIVGIELLAGTVVPASTALTYAIRLGGAIVPLGQQTAGQLNAGGALNPSIAFFVIMTGTPDMMPALDLAHSNARCSRPKLQLSHVWPKAPRTPPVPTSQIRVTERFEGYDPAQHAWGGKLLTGAGYLTQTPPSSFSDVIGADGALTRTYAYNLPAPVTSYKVLTTGTAITPLDVDLGCYIQDYVL